MFFLQLPISSWWAWVVKRFELIVWLFFKGWWWAYVGWRLAPISDVHTWQLKRSIPSTVFVVKSSGCSDHSTRRELLMASSFLPLLTQFTFRWKDKIHFSPCHSLFITIFDLSDNRKLFIWNSIYSSDALAYCSVNTTVTTHTYQKYIEILFAFQFFAIAMDFACVDTKFTKMFVYRIQHFEYMAFWHIYVIRSMLMESFWSQKMPPML